jgi:hypothetical protein
MVPLGSPGKKTVRSKVLLMIFTLGTIFLTAIYEGTPFYWELVARKKAPDKDKCNKIRST